MTDHYFKKHYMQMPYWTDVEGSFIHHGNAVVGGTDVNGETLYVGRALQEGDCIPGKVVPSHCVCYVPHGGSEHSHSAYQVLLENGAELCWITEANGVIPTGAIQGGQTIEGENLFIGRTFHEGSHCIGKVHPSHGLLYIPFGGEEHGFDIYEVFCLKTVLI